jgi:uroporphyrin-3 C-methyltransferase
MDPSATKGEAASTMTAPPVRPGPFSVPVSRGLFIVPAVLLAAVLAVVTVGLRNDQRDLKLEVGQRLAQAEAAAAEARTRNTDLANELREALAKVALLEARVAESQTQQASLEALYRELAPSRDEVEMNEIEQVLMLASQQLAIANNVQAALAALQLAEAKLGRVDRPQLVSLRRALARDLDKL